jgi:hypothetical protein
VTRLISAEILKVRTTRLWVGLVIGGLVLVSVATVAVLAVAGTTQGLAQGLGPITSVEDVRMLVWNGAAMSFFAVVLAATMATGEFRYGTVGSTYLATPSRWNVIGAKLVAAIPLGAAYGLLGGVLPVLIAVAWFAVKGDPLPFGVRGAGSRSSRSCSSARTVRRSPCASAPRSGASSWPSSGCSGGSSSPSPSRRRSFRRSKKWAPFAGAQGAFGPPDPKLFGHVAAAALMVLYVASAMYAAVWLERRRDV